MAAPYLLDPQGKLRANSVVTFDPSGRVTQVRYELPPHELDAQPGTEYLNGILVPGLVNAHCHLELSFFRGAIPTHTGLVEFVRQVISRRGQCPREQQVRQAQQQDLAMWHEGIQAVGDISNDTVSFPAKARAAEQGRTRYHTFAEYFGMPADTPQAARHEYERQVEPLLQAAAPLGLRITPTPHSTYLVSDRLFRLGGDSSRVSIHFMETPSELGFYRGGGGMYDFVRSGGMTPDFLHYGSHPRRLVQSLPRELPMLLVHCTQMQEADLEQVLNHFTDVTFVLCPRSNYYIEGGYPPAEMFLKAGARVALGTDGLSSNTALSVVEEIKCLAQREEGISLDRLLQWATAGGAAGLGLEGEIGSFEVGRRPGAVLLSPVDFRTMRPTEQTRGVRII